MYFVSVSVTNIDWFPALLFENSVSVKKMLNKLTIITILIALQCAYIQQKSCYHVEDCWLSSQKNMRLHYGKYSQHCQVCIWHFEAEILFCFSVKARELQMYWALNKSWTYLFRNCMSLWYLIIVLSDNFLFFSYNLGMLIN